MLHWERKVLRVFKELRDPRVLKEQLGQLEILVVMVLKEHKEHKEHWVQLVKTVWLELKELRVPRDR
jgi:hypothetical protein